MLEARLQQQAKTSPAASTTTKTTGQVSSNLASSTGTLSAKVQANTQKAITDINNILNQKTATVQKVSVNTVDMQRTAEKIVEDYMRNGELRFGMGTDGVQTFVDNTKKKVDDPGNAIDEMFGDKAAEVNYYFNLSNMDLQNDIDTKTTKSKAEVTDFNLKVDSALSGLFSGIGSGLSSIAKSLLTGLGDIGTDLKNAVNGLGGKLREGIDAISSFLGDGFGIFGDVFSLGFIDFLGLFGRSIEIPEEELELQMEKQFRIAKKIAEKFQVEEIGRLIR